MVEDASSVPALAHLIRKKLESLGRAELVVFNWKNKLL